MTVCSPTVFNCFQSNKHKKENRKGLATFDKRNYFPYAFLPSMREKVEKDENDAGRIVEVLDEEPADAPAEQDIGSPRLAG